jgi:hypothetical protein
VGVGEVKQETNDKTAGNINKKRSVGEPDAFCQMLDISAHKIPQNGADKPAHADDQKFHHKKAARLIITPE